MDRPAQADCLCEIARREVPADVVARTDELVAFNDVNPQAPRHVLIVPKGHISTTNDLAAEEAELVGKMVLLARDIAEEHDFAESGYRLIFNCNGQGGQSVFHIHLHMLGGRYLTWPPG